MNVMAAFFLIVAWGLAIPVQFLSPEWWSRVFIGCAIMFILEMFRTDKK